MTPQRNHTQEDAKPQETIRELLPKRMRLAILRLLGSVLEEGVNEFIQAALYQSTPERIDQRTGHYARDQVTTMGEIEELEVTRTRSGFRMQLFE